MKKATDSFARPLRLLLALVLILSLAAGAAAETAVPAEPLSVPDAAWLQENVLLPAAAFPEGTAGSSLKQAELVNTLWELSAGEQMDKMDPAALSEAIRAAFGALPEEQQTVLAEQLPALAEALRLSLDPDEAACSLYEDAGVAETLSALRESPEARLAAENLLQGLDALLPPPAAE